MKDAPTARGRARRTLLRLLQAVKRPAALLAVGVLGGSLAASACGGGGNNQSATSPPATATATAVASATPAASATPPPSPTVVAPATPAVPPTIPPLAGGAERTPPAGDDETLARSMLLTESDLPGFTGTQIESSSDVDLDACERLAYASDEPTAYAEAYFESTYSFIGQIMYVFASTSAASKGFSAVPSVTQCLSDELRSGGINAPGFTVIGVTYSQQSFPRFGDDSALYRYQVDALSTGGASVAVAEDVIVVSKGRENTWIITTSPSPFDLSTLQSLAENASAKMK